MNFAEWWRRGATAEAELEATVAEWQWADVEKRRKKAWLRPIGTVVRVLFYAGLFGAAFYFLPPNLFSRPIAELSLGDIFMAVMWALITFKIAHAFLNPNPRPDFREWMGQAGVVMIGVVLIGVVAVMLMQR